MRRPFRSSAGDLTPVAPHEVDELTRSRLMSATAPSAQASMRVLAWMFLGGATFAIGVIALTQSNNLTDSVMLPLICAAYVVGCGLLLGSRRLPRVTIDAALAVGIVMVTVAISHLGHTSEQSLSFLYVWPPPTPPFLPPRGRAPTQLGLLPASSAVSLAPADNPFADAAQLWLLTVGTAVLA